MSSGGGGPDWGTIGTLGGAALGIALAPATGGASLLMSGAAGAGLGGAIGNVLDGPPEVDTGWASPGMGEKGLEQRLVDQATGAAGPSAAELQMRRGIDQANQNAIGLAASQRGVNPGLAASLAFRQQALNQTEGNQQAGIMRAQEGLTANQLLASMYSSQRGSAAQAAALQQQAAQAQQQQFNNVISSAGKAGLMYSMMGKGGADPTGTQTASVPTIGSAFQNAETFAYNGGLIKGNAKVPGDSKKNDTVKVMVSPGEMIIPRTVVKKGPEAVASFAEALMKKAGKDAA